MKVLVACEESQEVCKAFRELGHEAYSCDIQECSGGHPEWHIQGDVLPLLKEKWDLIIAHPPCTDLAVSGARWFKKKRADGRQQRSIDFFMEFANCECERVAIENPVCIMSSVWRKPDQIIHPWQFGHPEQKKTCLWLKGLPNLKETKNVYDLMMTLPEREREREFGGLEAGIQKKEARHFPVLPALWLNNGEVNAMDDRTLAMLGDKAAQERITERGELLPCQCGGKPQIGCFEKRGIPSGDMGYLASVKCTDCWAELRRWSLKKKWAKESAIKGWNTRAPILSAEEMEMLDERSV